MKQIKINKPIFTLNIPSKEWVNVIKYHQRKQYGSVWFKEKLNQVEIKEHKEKYPDSIFFFIGNKVVIECSKKYGHLNVILEILSFFNWEFGYGSQEVSDLIKVMLKKHFKVETSMLEISFHGNEPRLDELSKMYGEIDNKELCNRLKLTINTI